MVQIYGHTHDFGMSWKADVIYDVKCRVVQTKNCRVLQALDYFDVIKHPMDFARIRNKINRFEYNTADEILDDIRLIFSNCFTYNQPATVVAVAGSELERYFERRACELGLVDAKSVKGSSSSGITNGRKRKRMTL